MSDYKSTLEKVVKHSAASPLFAPLAYDDESCLFILEDKHIAFGFFSAPLVGANDLTITKLQTVLTLDFPEHTFVQWGMFASPDIDKVTSQYLLMRNSYFNGNLSLEGVRVNPETRELLKGMCESRVEFLKRSTVEPLEEISKQRVKTYTTFICVKIPISDEVPTERDVLEITEFRKALQGSLEATGFHPRTMDGAGYIWLMNTLLNWQVDARWRTETDLYDRTLPLRDQVMDYGNAFEIPRHGKYVHVGGRDVYSLSIKRFPESFSLPMTLKYFGDPFSGTRVIPENTLLVGTVYYPPQEKKRAAVDKRGKATAYQAYGPIMKWVPMLMKQKESFDILEESLSEGDKVVDFTLSVFMFMDKGTEAAKAIANARTLWREARFQIMDDRNITFPLFLNSLPFNTDKDAQMLLRRSRTFATRHVAQLLPIVSESAGTGTPALLISGRFGNLMALDLYDSSTNFNAVVPAASGSGKSFCVNYLTCEYLSLGARVWTIDVGRSYFKLCEELHGDFVEFAPESPVCLNPFPLIREYDEEEDMLVGILRVMAAPNEGLSDFQAAGLKRVLADCWIRHGRSLSIDIISSALIDEQDQRLKDVGEQLFPFTSQGSYGRYFNGENNVKFDNQYTVLELDHLKGRKHLQLVVLLQLIYQIHQAMYLGDPGLPKVLIVDESFDLLAESGEVSSFISGGYRKFRKHRGAALTICQSISDMYDAPAGRAIVENSANMLLLQQKRETIAQLQKSERLSLTESGYEYLKSVHTARGKYSEIMAYTDQPVGIGRLIVDRYTQLLYTTHAAEIQMINERKQRGMSTSEAIKDIVAMERRTEGSERAA